MLRKSKDEKYIFDKLKSFYNQDLKYDSGRILGSMCTKPDPIGLKAYNMFIESNLGDSGLFKGTSQMETEVIDSLGKLLHCNHSAGHIVTGGTEANLMAMSVAKYIFKEKSDEIPEVILPKTAHFSFKKICSMLSLKAVEVPLKNFKIDVNKLEDCISENTMAILSIAGTTELGLVDDIYEISEIAYSNDIYLHVDAALGGFIIPFLNYQNNTQINFDFECKGVSSITLDPHKMGLAPVPSGGILFRYKKYLDKLSIKTPYLTKDKQTTIVGTRTGASTAATWALLNYYGMDGYAKVVNDSLDLTDYFYNKLLDIEQVNLTCKPELNIVSFTVDNFDVDKLQLVLSKKGWMVSVSEYPHAIRIVLMPHVKKMHIDNFLIDLKEIIK